MADEKTVTPRINLLASLGSPSDTPSAGTVAVTFDYTAAPVKVALGTNNDVSVDKAKMKILFDLSTAHLPTGASAEIAGVEFMKPNEPTGTQAPSNVFEDESTFTDGSGASHTVYGKWKGSKHELKLVDDNKVGANGTEQDYGYKVWIKLTQGTSSSYYASDDPKVKNKPTTT
jgi:hypothetical protein